MKVCYKAVKDFEFISGIYENLGIAAACVNNSVIVRSGFNGSARRRSDTHHASAVFLYLVYSARAFFAHGIKLRVHFMLGYYILFYGSERAESDMERDVYYLNAHVLYAFQQFFRKVKSGSRRRT